MKWAVVSLSLAFTLAAAQLDMTTRTDPPMTTALPPQSDSTQTMPATANPRFVQFLKEVSHHASFDRLTPQERLLFSELVLAAEEGLQALDSFIDRMGLLDVLKLLDDLSEVDAHLFAGYLAQAMGYNATSEHEHEREGWGHLHQWIGNNHGIGHIVIGKRDPHGQHGHDHPYRTPFMELLHDLSEDDYCKDEHLNQAECKVLEGMTHTVSTHQSLTDYVNQVGYGAIFDLLNVLDPKHAHEVMSFVEMGLEQEKATAAQN